VALALCSTSNRLPWARFVSDMGLSDTGRWSAFFMSREEVSCRVNGGPGSSDIEHNGHTSSPCGDDMAAAEENARAGLPGFISRRPNHPLHLPTSMTLGSPSAHNHNVAQ
jgi:hypothetical protein